MKIKHISQRLVYKEPPETEFFSKPQTYAGIQHHLTSPWSPLFFFPPQKCIMGEVVAVRMYVKEAWSAVPPATPTPLIVVGRIAGWQAQFNERTTKLKWWRVLLLLILYLFAVLPKNYKFPCLCFSNMTHLGSFGIVVVIWIKMRICWKKNLPSRSFFFFFAVYLNGCRANHGTLEKSMPRNATLKKKKKSALMGTYFLIWQGWLPGFNFTPMLGEHYSNYSPCCHSFQLL